MNIYVRFFDFDTLVSDKEGVIQFLQSLPDVELTDELIEEIKDYINSDTTYPKRLKIRPHIYFILIKTIASSMEEFKANRKDSFNALKPQGLDLTSRKEIKVARRKLWLVQRGFDFQTSSVNSWYEQISISGYDI